MIVVAMMPALASADDALEVAEADVAAVVGGGGMWRLPLSKTTGSALVAAGLSVGDGGCEELISVGDAGAGVVEARNCALVCLCIML